VNILKKSLLALVLVFSTLPWAAVGEPADIIKDYQQALARENRGDCLTAIFMYQDILQRNPYYFEAKLGLARCYMETGSLSMAGQVLDSALDQEPASIEALNLLGKVYTQMKRFDEAEEIFRKSARIEPANLQTTYLLADLYRLRGRFSEAVDLYIRILRIHPRDVGAYLNLGILYTRMGELEKAGGYFRKAVSLDNQDPRTHVNLARHYFRMGVSRVVDEPDAAGDYLDAALQESSVALAIQDDYMEAHQVAAQVFLYRGDFLSAAERYGILLSADPDDHLLLYTLGFCLEMTGNSVNAADAYSAALGERIDDEVIRFRLENLVLDLYREQLEHPLRVRLAGHHQRLGGFFMERNLMAKAFLHYKRAIMLHPVDPDKRLALAELLRMQGFDERYLFELEQIVRDTLDVDTLRVNDLIEIYRARTEKNLPSHWGIDQYSRGQGTPGSIPDTRVRVAVLDAFGSDMIQRDFLHSRLSLTISEMLRFALTYRPRIEVTPHGDDGAAHGTGDGADASGDPPAPLMTRQDALRRARQLGAGYYITGRVTEKNDSIELHLQVHSGLNGRVVADTPVFFTGNHKLFNAVVYAADFIEENLPFYGSIVRLEGDQALINLGSAHGVETGQEFTIVQEGGLEADPETGELTLTRNRELGVLTIEEVDEAVSAGTYEHSGRYNRVNVYDLVVLSSRP
jgi:tetratricopeptide (TPR) repeat protein